MARNNPAKRTESHVDVLRRQKKPKRRAIKTRQKTKQRMEAVMRALAKAGDGVGSLKLAGMAGMSSTAFDRVIHLLEAAGRVEVRKSHLRGRRRIYMTGTQQAVTPNHMVLTPPGWRQVVEVGDKQPPKSPAPPTFAKPLPADAGHGWLSLADETDIAVFAQVKLVMAMTELSIKRKVALIRQACCDTAAP